MKRLIILLIVLLLVIVSVSAENMLDYKELKLELTQAGHVEFVPSSEYAEVDYLEGVLHWFPRDTYRQQIIDMSLTPKPQFSNEETYTFRWDNNPKKASFTVLSELITESKVAEVKRKVSFPLTTIPSEYSKYTKHAEMIDENEDIRELAFSLAEGEDDLFVVVYNIADWVTNNIDYDLNSISAEAVQPSSWVLKNKKGVCDEMTNLFISMLRTLGVPARYIVGVAYTDNEEIFKENWGGHGWAEVYFPGTGWVPFDPAYGQYGYIDAGHIKLKDTVDSSTHSIDYELMGLNVNMKTSAMNFEVDIKDKKTSVEDYVDLTIEPYDTLVDFGSYNMISVNVKNKKDYYLSTRIMISQVQDTTLEGESNYNILLKPKQSQKFRFLYKVSDRLPRNYLYTFPIIVRVFDDEKESQFRAQSGKNFYNKNIFENIMKNEEVEKEYNKEFKTECEYQDAIYKGEILNVSCKLINEGDHDIKSMSICLMDQCKNSIKINKRSEALIYLEKELKREGIKALLVSFESELIEKSQIIKTEVVGETEVEIKDIKHPKTIEYDDVELVNFTIDRTADSVPKNLKVTLKHKKFEKSWELEDLSAPQVFRIRVGGRSLDTSKNEIKILVEYEDSLGKKYYANESFFVEPGSLTFTQKLMMKLESLELWLEGLFD